ncbi:MAG: hypothetical protein JNK61_09700 [Bacteroidia bacterium]|nr:hypothetical protein [Bacteroidia bacterium]HQV00427.1 hypothetical protein [Bacteroidia bacterium]
MITEVRKKYNSLFTDAQYQAFLNHLDVLYEKPVGFRVPETPIFIDKALKQKLINAGEQIIDVILQPDFKERTERAIPPQYNVKNENQHPHFLAIDFGICKDAEGNFTPQLIEMQGFASLYVWEQLIGRKYKEFFYCPDGYTPFFNGLNNQTYLDLLRKVIIGSYQPEQVVLMDINAHEQKTRIDFFATKEALGIPIVCLSELKQEGKKLYHTLNNKAIEVKRIYNRLIFDDLQANPDFKYSINLFDDLDVEWITHPNWFYRISKFTMPMVKSDFVPETIFLNTLQTIPADLENYVLKPLFSFSGMGVLIDVTPADIEKITDKENWILQRKVQYADAVQSPEGGVKCEIRLMYLWPDGDKRPTLAVNLARMSRGKMIGVRYNKDFTWVGGNIAFMQP